jgi:hypothetical protein
MKQYSNQSGLTEYNSGVWLLLPHRDPKTLSIESFVHGSERAWYVPNTVIRRDLQAPTVTAEIRRHCSQYSARLGAHPNDVVVDIMAQPDNRRFRRHLPNGLPTRFLV